MNIRKKQVHVQQTTPNNQTRTTACRCRDAFSDPLPAWNCTCKGTTPLFFKVPVTACKLVICFSMHIRNRLCCCANLYHQSCMIMCSTCGNILKANPKWQAVNYMIVVCVAVGKVGDERRSIELPVSFVIVF